MAIFSDPRNILYITALIAGIFIPTGIVVGLYNVKSHRYDLIKELERFLTPETQKDGQRLTIPSFDLIKYKYMPDDEKKRNYPFNQSHKWNFKYLIPTVLFIFITTTGFLIIAKHIRITPLFSEPTPSFYHLLNVLMITFISGYIWSVQYLIRRVANFDLSPVSFYRTLFHIFLGLIIMWTMHFLLISETSSGSALVNGNYLYAVAFLVGIQPTLFINYLASRFPYIKLKRSTPASDILREEIPLDTIMGIDTFIKFRLSEFEIDDVQNLATINPIQLYIETPYGFYEIIDWVAQAQLILAVGANNAVTLRQANVRTIFDLEKMIYNQELKNLLLKALMGNLPNIPAEVAATPVPAAAAPAPVAAAPAPIAANPAPVATNPALVLVNSELKMNEQDQLEAMISFIRDDLHVRRLRQIWDVVAWKTVQRQYSSKS